jgi:hypothetical protein
VQTERKSGGLGDLKYPLVSDVTKSISKSFGVLIADQVYCYFVDHLFVTYDLVILLDILLLLCISFCIIKFHESFQYYSTRELL